MLSKTGHTVGKALKSRPARFLETLISFIHTVLAFKAWAVIYGTYVAS